MKLFGAGFNSFINYLKLIFKNKLQLSKKHLFKTYQVKNEKFLVFRDTTGNDGLTGTEVTLIVGFRLKLIRNSKIMHWIFQRVCILTTPFWSGFPGMRTKLWMVNPQTYDYLGIYKWSGADRATYYAITLEKVLNFFSVKGSVWYEINKVDFEKYLSKASI